MSGATETLPRFNYMCELKSLLMFQSIFFEELISMEVWIGYEYTVKPQHLKAFIKLLPCLSHQLRLNPFLQFLGDRACRVQLFGVLVPLVQWHLVQLGLGSVQSLFHALKSGVAPVGTFVGVRRGGLGCWPIRKAVPFVELLLQYVGIPEKECIAYFPIWD